MSISATEHLCTSLRRLKREAERHPIGDERRVSTAARDLLRNLERGVHQAADHRDPATAEPLDLAAASIGRLRKDAEAWRNSIAPAAPRSHGAAVLEAPVADAAESAVTASATIPSAAWRAGSDDELKQNLREIFEALEPALEGLDAIAPHRRGKRFTEELDELRLRIGEFR